MISSLPRPYSRPNFSNHSRLRMAQRGIATPEVRAAICHGRKYHIRGARIFVIGRKEVKKAAFTGVDLREYEGIHVVCSTDHTVLTVYRNRRLNVRDRGLPRMRHSFSFGMMPAGAVT